MKRLVLFLLIIIAPGLAVSEPPKGMVLIPAGEFTMGINDTQAPDDQRPARKVNVDVFYIDKHEVTNAQFQEFILADGYNKRQFWTKDGWDYIQKERFYYSYPAREKYRIDKPLGFGDNVISTAPDHPVIGVSWYEASAYAKWAGKRLPTEAEWEKAARGTDARIYPWGNKFDFSKLNYFPHHEKLSPVGSFPDGASPYDVLDMAGNVAEWCADNIHGKEKKAVRGGGWNSIRLHLRSTHRVTHPPTFRYYNIGFRCANDVKQKSSNVEISPELKKVFTEIQPIYMHIAEIVRELVPLDKGIYNAMERQEEILSELKTIVNPDERWKLSVEFQSLIKLEHEIGAEMLKLQDKLTPFETELKRILSENGFQSQRDFETVHIKTYKAWVSE